MGPLWVWIAVAVLAAVGGGLLLAADYGRRTAHSRERRRWAALRGWRFVESDAVLPDRWRHGVVAHGGPGEAKDLVTGRLFTPDGRRTVHVFDHEQGGKVTGAIAAVARRTPFAATVELWLPDVPFRREVGLDLVGPVGIREAFADDLAAARPLVNPDLVAVCQEIGTDVPVVWLEDAWVLASAPAAATPARLEQLLRHLGEIADLVDRRIDGALARAGSIDGEHANNGSSGEIGNAETESFDRPSFGGADLDADPDADLDAELDAEPDADLDLALDAEVVDADEATTGSGDDGGENGEHSGEAGQDSAEAQRRALDT